MRLDNERNIGLVSLDIDGTLYPRKGRPLDWGHIKKTQQVIKDLRQAAISPIFCTGKIIGYVEAWCEACDILDAPRGLEAMNVAENGTVIFTYNQWPFDVKILPKELSGNNLEAKIHEAQQLIQKKFPELRFEYSKLISLSINVPEGHKTGNFYHLVVNALNEAGIVTMPKENTGKLAEDSYMLADMLLQHEKIGTIRDFVDNTGTHLFATHTATAIDIVPYPFTKGVALTYVAAQKGVPVSSVVAFGDSPGDWTVFDVVAKYGGIPIAVKGAGDATKKYVLERGGYITLRQEPYGLFDCVDLILRHKTVEGFRGDYKVACER